MSANGWLGIAVLVGVSLGCQAAAPRLEIEKTTGNADAKPECNAQSRSKIWPEKTARAAGTPVEMCLPKRFHYAWQPLTVDVSQLRAAAEAPEAAKPAPPK